MSYVWLQLRTAIPLLLHGRAGLVGIIGFTAEVTAIATAIATVLGVPVGLAIGLSRSRSQRLLTALASVSMALPPALVGVVLYFLFAGNGVLGPWHLEFSRTAVVIAQSVLALPYTIALTAAAVRGLPGGLLAQARSLGAGRAQLAALALREARIGVVAALVAAMGSTLAEVAAVVLVGGNDFGYDQTLASATLFDVSNGYYAQAIAVGIVLLAAVILLLGSLAVLQRRGSGSPWRFRTAS